MNRIAHWNRLRKELAGFRRGSDSARLAGLERFRQQLVASFGEEPTALITEPETRDTPQGCVVTEVALTDYFGWFLKAGSGAVYQAEGERFRLLAGFRPEGGLSPSAEFTHLARWLLANGPLVRSKLNLADLSAEEAETLLAELDTLQADLAVPIVVNETLWGFLTAGRPAGEEYDGSEALYLMLYGLSIASCRQRRKQGLLPKAEAEDLRDSQILRELQELWVSLRPTQRRIRLLIQEEEPDSAQMLSHFFSQWGFEVHLGKNQKGPPPSTKGSDPVNPHLILAVGTRHIELKTAGDLPGTLPAFRKPCRFALLARWIFEAAIALAVREGPQAAEAVPKSCLIVDDEEEAAWALKEYFQAKGSSVWTAADGEEALSLAARVQPNLIFLDLKLPKLAGSALLRRVRAASPQAKIIVLTAWAQEYPQERLRKTLQPDGYLLKPVPLDTLAQLAAAG